MKYEIKVYGLTKKLLNDVLYLVNKDIYSESDICKCLVQEVNTKTVELVQLAASVWLEHGHKDFTFGHYYDHIHYL
jgi:hypothetical protein